MKPTWPIQIQKRRQGQLLGIQFFIFFLKIIRDFDAFYLRWNKVPCFSSQYLNRFATKMYSSLKMITTSKFIGRMFAKLKNFIHNDRREIIFNFISFSSKISFVDCKGVITLQKFFEIDLNSHCKLFSKLVLVSC